MDRAIRSSRWMTLRQLESTSDIGPQFGEWTGWLGRRDSNPDTQLQRLQSYR